MIFFKNIIFGSQIKVIDTETLEKLDIEQIFDLNFEHNNALKLDFVEIINYF